MTGRMVSGVLLMFMLAVMGGFAAYVLGMGAMQEVNRCVCEMGRL